MAGRVRGRCVPTPSTRAGFTKQSAPSAVCCAMTVIRQLGVVFRTLICIRNSAIISLQYKQNRFLNSSSQCVKTRDPRPEALKSLEEKPAGCPRLRPAGRASSVQPDGLVLTMTREGCGARPLTPKSQRVNMNVFLLSSYLSAPASVFSNI